MDVREVNKRVNGCTRCGLHEGATQPVPGSGDPQARVLFIGEAPGRWEDRQGEPFVGRAGKLLDEMLQEIGLQRREVYITNVVKCRPPQNRRPTRGEIEECLPLLGRQIEAVSPRVIATLGAVAGEVMADKYGFSWDGMYKENGKVRELNTIMGKLTVLPIIHPAAILRNPNRKGMLRSAFKKLEELLG